MNIGILIFVISVIVTGISAMRDKSHEQRKIKCLHTKYTKSYAKHTKKKGIFEQIEEAFNEMASEFDEEEQTKTSSPKPSSKKKRFTVIKI